MEEQKQTEQGPQEGLGPESPELQGPEHLGQAHRVDAAWSGDMVAGPVRSLAADVPRIWLTIWFSPEMCTALFPAEGSGKAPELPTEGGARIVGVHSDSAAAAAHFTQPRGQEGLLVLFQAVVQRDCPNSPEAKLKVLHSSGDAVGKPSDWGIR